jgi:hypothetical protein
VTLPIAVAREPEWADVLLWLETIDAIIRGMGHALNNRALALGATLESLDPRKPIGGPTSAALSRESERLADQLRQFRILPFDVNREPIALLLHDVLSAALQLHRSHTSVGEVPCYLEGQLDTPPVLAAESALIHATLVLLTALKGFAAPNGVVRIAYSGTADEAKITFLAQRDPSDDSDALHAQGVIRPSSLAAALLASARVQIEQSLSPDVATVVWTLPSLKAMRRLARSG